MRTCVPKALIIIGLVNTICGVSPTLVFATTGLEFLFKYFLVENSHNSRPKFVADPITIPLLTTFMLGATIVSTLVVVMIASND